MSTPSPSPVPDNFKETLLDAQIAFDRGDFATVKARLTPLLSRSRPVRGPNPDSTSSVPPLPAVPEDVQRDASQLMDKVATDRSAVYLAFGCLLFFAVVVVQYIVR